MTVRPLSIFQTIFMLCLPFFLNSPAFAAKQPRGALPQSQPPPQQRDESALVTADAPIYIQPEMGRQPLRVAKAGSMLRIVGACDEWCNIEFQDPTYGRRVGYIQTKFLRLGSLEPTDLSIPQRQETQPAPNNAVSPTPEPAPPSPVEPVQQPPRPVPVRNSPVGTSSSRIDRGWIDIDFAHFQPRQDAQVFTYTTIINSEPAAFAAAYPKLGGNVDIGLSGGASFGNSPVGLTFRIDAQNYSYTAGLGASVPSPYFFNNSATGAGVSSPLERKDRALDISVMFTASLTDRWRLRVLGGPTYFHVTNQMVSTIVYSQFASPLFRTNLVSVDSYTDQKLTDSSWGFIWVLTWGTFLRATSELKASSTSTTEQSL